MSEKWKPYQKKLDYSYTFGVFPTLELLTHRLQDVQTVILSSGGSSNEGVAKIVDICTGHNIPVLQNDRLVNKLSPKENCYAIGVFGKYDMRLDEGKNHVLLVNPSNTGNLGTIIRTMVGFGLNNLGIVKPGVDIFDPKVIRSSMGALFQMRCEYFDSFEEYSSRFKHRILTLMVDGKKDISDPENYTRKPFCLVFGNESSGLGEEYHQLGTSVRISHSRAIDSLNLAIAVAIALYESTKQEFIV